MKTSIPKIVNVRLKNGNIPVLVPKQETQNSVSTRDALYTMLEESYIQNYDCGMFLMYSTEDKRTFTMISFKTDKDFMECLEIAKIRGLSS